MQHHGDVCTHGPGQVIAQSHLSALFHHPICPSGSSVGQSACSPAGPPLSGGVLTPSGGGGELRVEKEGTGGVALFKSLLTQSISTSLCMSAVG